MLQMLFICSFKNKSELMAADVPHYRGVVMRGDDCRREAAAEQGVCVCVRVIKC